MLFCSIDMVGSGFWIVYAKGTDFIPVRPLPNEWIVDYLWAV